MDKSELVFTKYAQALKGVTGAANAQTYFGRLGSDIKGVGAAVGNAVASGADTIGKAVQGWNTLLSPYKGTPAQKMEWAGKAVKSVATDFIPGMAQGAINLPANVVKGVSDIGTGTVNSLSGGFFDKAKKNVDNFTNKLTDPFKVNFAGDRTGVAQESFNVGQFTGETAATAGAGAATNAVRTQAAKGLNYALPRVPKDISSVYAKGITKLTGDKYPITGPERSLYNFAKKDGAIVRGESPLFETNKSFYSIEGSIPSNDVIKNRTFLSKPDNFPENRFRTNTKTYTDPYTEMINYPTKSKHMGIDKYLTEKNNPYNSNLSKFTESRTYVDDVTNKHVSGPPLPIDVGKILKGRDSIFIDKPSRTAAIAVKDPTFKQAWSARQAQGFDMANDFKKGKPMTTFTHEAGHKLDKFEFRDAGRKVNSLERTPAQQNGMLTEESAANLKGVTYLKQHSNWYNPTNWLRDERFKLKQEPSFNTYRQANPQGGYANKDLFGNDIPNYAKKGVTNAFKVAPVTNTGKQNTQFPLTPLPKF
jgi:hypothetical protein